MLTSVLSLSLSACLQDPVVAVEAAPAPVVAVEAAPASNPAPYVAPVAETRRSRVAFGVMPSLTVGVDDVPSGSSALFLGVRLRGDAWALGYQFTGTLGLMARGELVPLAHRHHVTAVTHFKRRGYATLGGGAAVYFMGGPSMEFEAKLGVRFGPNRRAVFGGVARLGLDFFYRERLPLPQVGLFLGFSLL